MLKISGHLSTLLSSPKIFSFSALQVLICNSKITLYVGHFDSYCRNPYQNPPKLSSQKFQFFQFPNVGKRIGDTNKLLRLPVSPYFVMLQLLPLLSDH